MKLEPATVLMTASPEHTHPAAPPRRYEFVLVLAVIAWLLVWYGDTARSIVAIWERSETFAHGYLIVPISVWLIWRRRRELAVLDMRPNFMVLPLLALIGFGWLLGQLAGAAVVQQYCLVLMIPLLVWTVLGNQPVRVLAFPLFFLLFTVPFGEFLLPSLMEQTADVLIFALKLTGIPVYREGQFFALPSGSWSVVEACSGLRYLIASVTLGFLYAYLTYRSFARRAIFVVVSVIVPIVANWLRAYMIVMIGHLSGMKYAVGVDHLIYGWIFFGVVMLILFGIGSIWREDLPHQAAPASVASAQRDKSPWGTLMAATIAVAVIVAIWPVTAARLEGAGPYPPLVLQAPPPAQSWQPVTGPLTDWSPHFSHPQAQFNQVYARDAGRVGLYIGYYRNQRDGAELITSKNTLVSSADRTWASVGQTGRVLIFNNEEVPLIEARLRGQSTQLLVWSWYWVDGQYTVSPYWAKLLQVKSQLFGRGDDGAVVIVYTELDTNREGPAARLQEFVNAMLPAITSSLQHVR